MPEADRNVVRGGALHVMRNEALYGGVPLWHEACQPIQVSVARIDESKVCEAVYACQVMAAPDFCPELPAYAFSPQTCSNIPFTERIASLANLMPTHFPSLSVCILPRRVWGLTSNGNTPDLGLSLDGYVQGLPLRLGGSLVCNFASALLMLSWCTGFVLQICPATS